MEFNSAFKELNYVYSSLSLCVVQLSENYFSWNCSNGSNCRRNDVPLCYSRFYSATCTPIATVFGRIHFSVNVTGNVVKMYSYVT